MASHRPEPNTTATPYHRPHHSLDEVDLAVRGHILKVLAGEMRDVGSSPGAADQQKRKTQRSGLHGWGTQRAQQRSTGQCTPHMPFTPREVYFETRAFGRITERLGLDDLFAELPRASPDRRGFGFRCDPAPGVVVGPLRTCRRDLAMYAEQAAAMHLRRWARAHGKASR